MDKEVNFDVMNTLYLIKQSLGDSYLDEDFNPFNDDFILNKNSVRHFLEVKAEKKQVEPPEFVNKSEKEILSSLKNGVLNTKKLLQELEKEDINNTYIQHIIIYLKIRLKMLSDLTKDALKYEELVDVMQTLEALDKNYAKILAKSFQKNFDVQLAIKHFLQLCKQKQQMLLAKKVEQKKKQQSQKQKHQVQHTIAQKTQQAVNRVPKKEKKQKENEMSM